MDGGKDGIKNGSTISHTAAIASLQFNGTTNPFGRIAVVGDAHRRLKPCG
jgi:hypothetical protein